jgi:hypothetical protein
MRKEQDIHIRLNPGIKDEAKKYSRLECRTVSGFIENAKNEA